LVDDGDLPAIAAEPLPEDDGDLPAVVPENFPFFRPCSLPPIVSAGSTSFLGKSLTTSGRPLPEHGADLWAATEWSPLAIETGIEKITTDGGFGRFRGLIGHHPLPS